ncbi:MAG: AAA family ATPase [Lachnospiraceae bacterium]|nr:AAA family ATPase [Lachnospiraceae bacterium]
MSFVVGIGESDFEDLMAEKAYYVDKTEFIYDIVRRANNKVTWITRPRRFGKTLMMSVLENFFDVRKNSASLFAGLNVCKHSDFCQEWMNKYPVFSISFKDVESDDFETAYDKLKATIANVCKKYSDLADSPKINPYDRELFLRLQAQTVSRSDLQYAMNTVIRMMRAVYGEKVIVLIDEYDVPLAIASEKNTAGNQYYEKMLDVIRGLIKAALKDNTDVRFAVVTGCLRIAKESIFTGSNNFAAYSVTDDLFSEYFGFTEEEVQALLQAAGRSSSAQIIKDWYDGYVFGHSHIYCPWDVINYVSTLNNAGDARPQNYWKNTSHNGVLMTFVKRTDFQVKGKFEALMNGGFVEQTITEELTYDTLHASEDNLWSVLLMTGYVTKIDPDDSGEMTRLKIPNKEIATIFEDTVVQYFRDTIDTSKQKDLMRALWDRDSATATRIISDFLWRTISYFDYKEDYYHAFLAGIFVGMGYEVETNKERGLGRPDIVLKDHDGRRAILIEAKKADSAAELDKECAKAFDQIDINQYARGLYGYEQVLCYGVAFFQKQAKVKLHSVLTEEV